MSDSTRDKAVGTHMGRLDPEARARRSAKNARNRSRRGQATRPRGSSKRTFTGSRRTG